MSKDALVWAFRELKGGRVPPTASYVLLTLAHIHSPIRGCQAKRTALCARLGLSESALKRAITQLVKAGLVKLGDRRGGLRKYYLQHGRSWMP